VEDFFRNKLSIIEELGEKEAPFYDMLSEIWGSDPGESFVGIAGDKKKAFQEKVSFGGFTKRKSGGYEVDPESFEIFNGEDSPDWERLQVSLAEGDLNASYIQATDSNLKTYVTYSKNEMFIYQINVYTSPIGEKKVWVGSIQTNQGSELTEYGLKSKVIDTFGRLFTPAREYRDQIPEGFDRGGHIEGKYWDASSFTHKIPIVAEFIQEVLGGDLGQVRKEQQKVDDLIALEEVWVDADDIMEEEVISPSAIKDRGQFPILRLPEALNDDNESSQETRREEGLRQVRNTEAMNFDGSYYKSELDLMIKHPIFGKMIEEENGRFRVKGFKDIYGQIQRDRSQDYESRTIFITYGYLQMKAQQEFESNPNLNPLEFWDGTEDFSVWQEQHNKWSEKQTEERDGEEYYEQQLKALARHKLYRLLVQKNENGGWDFIGYRDLYRALQRSPKKDETGITASRAYKVFQSLMTEEFQDYLTLDSKEFWNGEGDFETWFIAHKKWIEAGKPGDHFFRWDFQGYRIKLKKISKHPLYGKMLRLDEDDNFEFIGYDNIHTQMRRDPKRDLQSNTWGVYGQLQRLVAEEFHQDASLNSLEFWDGTEDFSVWLEQHKEWKQTSVRGYVDDRVISIDVGEIHRELEEISMDPFYGKFLKVDGIGKYRLMKDPHNYVKMNGKLKDSDYEKMTNTIMTYATFLNFLEKEALTSKSFDAGRYWDGKGKYNNWLESNNHYLLSVVSDVYPELVEIRESSNGGVVYSIAKEGHFSFMSSSKKIYHRSLATSSIEAMGFLEKVLQEFLKVRGFASPQEFAYKLKEKHDYKSERQGIFAGMKRAVGGFFGYSG
jgi:hypothetical protein